MFYDFTFGLTHKSLSTFIERELISVITPDKPIFINSQESSVRELFAYQLATEHLYRTGKRTLWMRLDPEPPFFLPGGRDEFVDAINLSGNDWSGKLARIFIEFGRTEENFSCVVLDSCCSAETYSGKSTAKQATRRMEKINNAIRKLRRKICSRGVHLIVLGHVDETLKNPKPVASLTKREFNDIKSHFGFVLTISNLAVSHRELVFGRVDSAADEIFCNGHISIREFNHIGQPIAGIEECFSISETDIPTQEKKPTANMAA